jgi:hypothetical protein
MQPMLQGAEFPAARRRREQAAELAAWSASIARSYDRACDDGADTHSRKCEAINALGRAFDALAVYADVLDGPFLSGRDLLGQMADMASDMAGAVARSANQ